MTTRSGRPQTSSFHSLVTYPEQHIVESVETTQHQRSNNVDGATHGSHIATQHTRETAHRVSDGWTRTATIVRVDSFSRTRNDDEEDIFMSEDATEDGDSVVTQVRVDEDMAMEPRHCKERCLH